jgi:hypothetical protein
LSSSRAFSYFNGNDMSAVLAWQRAVSLSCAFCFVHHCWNSAYSQSVCWAASRPSLSMSLPSCIEQALGPAALFLNVQNILEPFGYTHWSKVGFN